MWTPLKTFKPSLLYLIPLKILINLTWNWDSKPGIYRYRYQIGIGRYEKKPYRLLSDPPILKMAFIGVYRYRPIWKKAYRSYPDVVEAPSFHGMGVYKTSLDTYKYFFCAVCSSKFQKIVVKLGPQFWQRIESFFKYFVNYFTWLYYFSNWLKVKIRFSKGSGITRSRR